MMVSPSERPSARRTEAFKGRRKVTERLSGKIEVVHFVEPSLTLTGIEPNPLLAFAYFSFNSADSFLSTCAKCHAPPCPELVEWVPPGQTHTFARTLYDFVISF